MRKFQFFSRTLYLVAFYLLFANKALYSENSKIISNNISNNTISSIAEDSKGYIWIGTNRGLNRFNGFEYRQYLNVPGDSTTISDNQILSIFKDSKSRLWVSTINGINLYTEKDNFKYIPIYSFNPNAERIFESSSGTIYANIFWALTKYDQERGGFTYLTGFDGFYNKSLIDKGNRIWIFSTRKVVCYNESLKIEKELPIKIEGEIFNCSVDKRGIIWIASESGLFLINSNTKEYINLPAELKNDIAFRNSVVANVYDYNDKLLISTINNGFFQYDWSKGTLIHDSSNKFPFKTTREESRVMFSDSRKNLWIGTRDNGIFVNYNSKKKFNNDLILADKFRNTSVVFIEQDKQKNLWIATRKDGLYFYSSANKSVEKVSGLGLPFILDELFFDSDNNLWILGGKYLKKFSVTGSRINELNSYLFDNSALTICQDRMGTIWVGSNNESLYSLKKGEKEFKRFQVFPLGYNFVSVLKLLSDGRVLIAGFNNDIVLLNTENMKTERIPIVDKIIHSRFVPMAIYEDSEQNIWIGTKSNGLFRYNPSQKKVDRFSDKDGLPCEDIASMIEDAQGNLWVGTFNGLSKFDRTTSQFYNWYEEDGTGGNQFNEKSIYRLPNNSVILGGTHGITLFEPLDVTFPREYPLYFEDLIILTRNGQVPIENTRCADKYVGHNPKITLGYNDNNIFILFSAIHFSEYSRINYSYKMEGLDGQWIKSGKSRQAYYSKLPPGKYKFRVRIDNQNSSDKFTESVLEIRVKRSPLGSAVAILLYSAILILIFIYITRLYIQIKTNKAQALLAERENQNVKKMNEMNMNFFTNMSHEFRTPLTMIAGPVSQLLKNEKIDNDSKYLLSLINRSVLKMLNLINQILDFRRLDEDAVKLQVERADIINELKKVLEIFSINFKEKSVKLYTRGMIDSYITWLDSDKLDKVLTNLFSNALKFTPSGGQVVLEFDIISRDECVTMFPKASIPAVNSDYVCIKVKDSGKGFSENSMDKIFEKYFIDSSYKEGMQNWSSGIGLYYSRRLVNLHHGYIKAENAPDKGAIISFVLPVSDNMYKDEERITEVPKENKAKLVQIITDSDSLPDEITKKEFDNTVLIIEDDTEVSYYLKLLLSKNYYVVSRHSAVNLIDELDEINPNLILSDIVMPGMDGLQFCKLVKENSSYSHIPVVLLTAKVAVENQIEGLDYGADAYVTKPFEPEYLLALIRSQLANRSKLQSIVLESTSIHAVETEETNVSLSQLDKQFIDQLYELMEKELSNPELNITQLSYQMKLGRTKLYYKIKGLTGETPNVFFNRYKLNRAVELLKSGRFNVSEVADMTGFKTSSHFSTVFKKQFGESPTKYLDKK